MAHQIDVNVFDLSENKALNYNDKLLYIIKKYPEKFSSHVAVVNTDAKQVALLERSGKVVDVQPTGMQGFFWKQTQPTDVHIIDIIEQKQIPEELRYKLKSTPSLGKVLRPIITQVAIPEKHIGFMYEHKQFQKTLKSGVYAWWTPEGEVDVTVVDLRLQNMEVSSQEILTKDHVGIRVNLLATWKINDPEKLVMHVKEYKEFLYREMQLALRTAIATKTLDELLTDKNLLNEALKEATSIRSSEYGISIESVGVKDIILPGDMKMILAQVVEAQKMSEANIIKRREETQATRSLHNTAKVMENNPTLLRLKELETLEKITASINNLNVYGGLDGVLNGLVNLNTDKPSKPTPKP